MRYCDALSLGVFTVTALISPAAAQELPGHWCAGTGVAFSPDGKLLASVSIDGTVRLWEMAAGNHQSVLKDHENAWLSVAFSPDGKTLATGAINESIKLWDLRTKKIVRTFPIPSPGDS
jgi:WD40 repeat protein